VGLRSGGVKLTLSSLTRKVPNTHPPQAAKPYSELVFYGSAGLTEGGAGSHW